MTRLLVFTLVLLSVLPVAPAEIVDRIALTIDQQVITESQIDEEIRVTAFLNRQPPHWTNDERRAAADRMIQQVLVEREMNLGHYPPPSEADVQNYLNGLVSAFGGQASFTTTLKASQIDAETLKNHLNLQLTALRFIEYRFRPNFEISEEEIQAYRRQAPKPLSKEAIRETLTQQHTNEILGAWLEETRKQVNLVYLDTTLQ